MIYIDISAAFKLVFDQAESEALTNYLATARDQDVVSAWLLHTELHCAARRRGIPSGERVADTLSRIELIDVSRHNFAQAAADSRGLRSADALHLAVALDTRADAMLVYDEELAAAANDAGLTVIAPI